jgi:hypothetical protein
MKINQKAQEFCQQNGWTDIQKREGVFWAFPPGGVMPLPLPLSEQSSFSESVHSLWGRTSFFTSALVATRVWPFSLEFRDEFMQFAYDYSKLEQSQAGLGLQFGIKLIDIYSYFFSSFLLAATVSVVTGLLLTYLLRKYLLRQLVPRFGSLLWFSLKLTVIPYAGHLFIFFLVYFLDFLYTLS